MWNIWESSSVVSLWRYGGHRRSGDWHSPVQSMRDCGWQCEDDTSGSQMNRQSAADYRIFEAVQNTDYVAQVHCGICEPHPPHVHSPNKLRMSANLKTHRGMWGFLFIEYRVSSHETRVSSHKNRVSSHKSRVSSHRNRVYSLFTGKQASAPVDSDQLSLQSTVCLRKRRHLIIFAITLSAVLLS